MKDRWKRTSLLSASVAFILAATGCGNDPVPITCKPRALLYDHDSITYSYMGGKIRTVSYYVSGRQTNQDDLTYNLSGQLSTIAKSVIEIDGTMDVQAHHTLSYDIAGRPSTLLTDAVSGHFETTFTHNEQGQLATAETKAGIQQQSFLGSTRYEYDSDGNIPNVYYTLNINRQRVEKLARENLSFDDQGKFYFNSEELKVLNEYVYGYLPTKNNCLSSVIHYYDYTQHFTTPLEISFVATYNDKGQIQSLQTEGPNTQLYSGEVLFKNILYDCR